MVLSAFRLVKVQNYKPMPSLPISIYQLVPRILSARRKQMITKARTSLLTVALLFSILTAPALYPMVLWISTAEAAGEPTKANIPPWAQFGEVTIHSASVFIRFVVFDNWDLLVELHEPSSIKKTLQLQSSTMSLYSGLTEAELSSPAKNPFMFFDMALAPVLGPLSVAFPEGIDQIPYTETSFSTVSEKRQFHGVVERTSSDLVRYDLTMSEGGNSQSFRCYGTWQKTRKSPLPDDFSLQEWQLQKGPSGVETNSVRTLGEVRKKQELPKPSPSPQRP